MSLKKIIITLLFLGTGVLLATKLVSSFYTNRYNTNAYAGYEKLWAKVDSCENLGLTESVLKYVMGIYTLAKKDDNAPQIVKSLIYRMKYNVQKEETEQEKNIKLLNEEIKTASFPAKAILQSILAESYWDYYEQNRWKFYERSQTTEIKDDDISTYDLKTLVAKTIQTYQLSLKGHQALKKYRLEEFNHILNKGNVQSQIVRPTLYDLLAHRALDLFMNSEAEVTKTGAGQFNLNHEVFFKPYPDFMNYQVAKPTDSLGLKYHAIIIFQDLLKFHAGQNDKEALADLELKRLNFIKNHSVNSNADSFYVSNLRWQQKHFTQSHFVNRFKHLEAIWWLDKAENYRPLESNKHQWDRKTALELCNAIIASGDTGHAAKIATNTLQQIKTKSLNLTAEEVLQPKVNNRFLLTYANVNKVYFRIVKAVFSGYQAHLRKNYNSPIPFLITLPVLQTFEYDLPNDGDYNTHSTELPLPALAHGHYVLLSSLKKDFSETENILHYQSLVVSDLAYLCKGKNNGGNELYVLNRQTGEAVEGAKVRSFVYDYDYNVREYSMSPGGTYTSGKNGYVKLEKTNKNYFIEISRNSDTLFPKNRVYGHDYGYTQESTTRSYIFTDRAIYRPGQTIYFKSIVFDGSNNKYKVKPASKITVTFSDVNGQKISELNLITNDYGTVAGSFVAPQGLLNGQMMIHDGISGVNISVEEYKRPKFEVLFDTLKGTYRLNEAVVVKGNAKAFAGNVVDGAKVSYRVVRKVNYPYWFGWFKPYASRAEEAEIENGITSTNEKGEFEVKFKALPDLSVSEKDEASFSFEIIADVTDLNGETRSSLTNVTIGYKLLELSCNAPETILTTKVPKISLSAKNLNGAEEFVSGQLQVYSLTMPVKIFRERLWLQPDRQVLKKEEYYKKFPLDLYADELNKYKWERSKKIISKTFNTQTDKSILSEEIKNLQPGVYCLEAICKDRLDNEVKCVNYITVFNPEKNKLPYPTAIWQTGITTRVEPGQKASFVIASSFKKLNCIFETESEGGVKQSFVKNLTKLIEITAEEKDRGGIQTDAIFVKQGRFYRASVFIDVPHSNKEIDIEFSTFRNKLLPGQNEEWKITLKNKRGEKIAAELLASMYDASLDQITPHNWSYYLYNSFNSRHNWEHTLNHVSRSQGHSSFNVTYINVDEEIYDQLNLFGLKYQGGGYGEGGGKLSVKFNSRANAEGYALSATPAEAKAKDEEPMYDKIEVAKFAPSSPKKDAVEGTKTTNVAGTQVRKNFNETAFFFPQLNTNANGEVIIKFTMPESLTRWKFMSLAHTKDMAIGMAQNECVTQKELMVIPNAPRFLREGDSFSFGSKISNLSGKDLEGSAELHFFDPINDKDITQQLTGKETVQKKFSSKAGQSTLLEWNIEVPAALQMVKYQIVAKAGNFSDGEELALAVLSNRMLVTESLPLPIKGGQTKQFTFTKFINRNNNSTTLKDHAYTIEFTSNPAWYAVQSLPYLMEYPYECAEQTFSRYYANALAAHIANSKPQIKEVFNSWKNQSPESFLSNLEKNQELKALLIQETPWVLQSKNESENKKRLGLLFDLNHMSNELTTALNKLQKMQTPNGGWPWFEGCPEDWYITQHIAIGLAHLEKIGVINFSQNQNLKLMVERAIAFCDAGIAKSFNELKRADKNYLTTNRLGGVEIQYLYMRSYFANNQVPDHAKEAFEYYKKQAQQYWTKQTRHLQGMLALSLNRYNDKKTAGNIVTSLKQNALVNEEMGMYWKENYPGYYWYQAPIEMQALMVEVFDEVANDAKAVNELKTWLIKSKQTQHWGSTRATTDAVYALLLKGDNWLSTEPEVSVTIGKTELNPATDASLKTEPGTGYFKKTFVQNQIQANMGKITVTKKGNGVAWGSAHWQYFEQLDKITPHATPLTLSKKVYLTKNTSAGPVIEPVTENTEIKVGDKLKIRIELRSDRDMEYLHLKDMRAAGLEPVNVLSGYRYQDGLGYYESTGDAATNFFISYLPKGTYVFEYPVYVSHKGNFSNGISSIQCMYAPEFNSHSQGLRLRVSGR